MSNELVREKLILDQNVGRETTQVLLEGDIIVPDVKPDMSVMLQADSKISIDKVEVSADRINYMGKLNIQVLYLARGNEKPVHSMSITAPIDDFVNFEGVAKDMWVEVKADIQNVDYKMINDRKISYRAVADIHCSVETSHVNEIVVNIDGLPENQQKKTALSLNKSVTNKADRFVVKDDISVPAGKPNIREILQTNIEVANQDVRVMSGKVNVFGELLVTTLYKGDSDDSILEFMEHEIPFNGNIEIPETKEDMFADVLLDLQDQYIQVRPDDDGEERIIEVETAVNVSVKLNAQMNVEILEDAHCINKKLNITKNPVKYPKLVCRNKNQSNIKEIAQLEPGAPDILQIFRVKGKAITDDVKVVNDKVIVEGVIETDILYIAENDDTPLYSFKTMIPFRQIIETKGSAPDMNVNMNVAVDHVGFNMLSGREVELRFLLSFNTHVSETMEASMISDIEFLDMDKEYLDMMPSITVYVVQTGDTLWKIAKMYNTSIDELIAINDIENPDSIFPGQKLLILKKVGMM